MAMYERWFLVPFWSWEWNMLWTTSQDARTVNWCFSNYLFDMHFASCFLFIKSCRRRSLTHFRSYVTLNNYSVHQKLVALLPQLPTAICYPLLRPTTLNKLEPMWSPSGIFYSLRTSKSSWPNSWIVWRRKYTNSMKICARLLASL